MTTCSLRMNKQPLTVDDCIREALAEVDLLMQAAFEKVGGVAPPGSALDQNGLVDGHGRVTELINVGEPGLALEHLIYMVDEPSLAISQRAYVCIEFAGNAMSMDKRLWECIRPPGRRS